MVDHNGWQKVVRAVNDKLTLNKCLLNLEQTLFHPYGTIFEVTDRNTGELQVVEDPREFLTKSFLEEFNPEAEDQAEGKDNRDIVVDH